MQNEEPSPPSQLMSVTDADGILVADELVSDADMQSADHDTANELVLNGAPMVCFG